MVTARDTGQGSRPTPASGGYRLDEAQMWTVGIWTCKKPEFCLYMSSFATETGEYHKSKDAVASIVALM